MNRHQVMGTRLAELYETDFYAWAHDQAEALRRLAATRPNAEIDLENLIDEVEGLARSDLRAVMSQLRRLIKHLLKLDHARAREPRLGWMRSVDDARTEIGDILTPTLRKDVEARLPQLYVQARREAEKELGNNREDAAAVDLPPDCPYELERLLADDWYPEGVAADRAG